MGNPHIKKITLAMMLLIVGWGIPKLLVSLTNTSRAGTYELGEVSAALNEEWLSEAEPDLLDLEEENMDEEPDRKKRNKATKEIYEVRTSMQEEDDYIEDRVDAHIGKMSSNSSTIWWYLLYLKTQWLFALLQIAAVFLLIMGGLGLVEDQTADSTTKWFAIVTTAVALFCMLTPSNLFWGVSSADRIAADAQESAEEESISSSRSSRETPEPDYGGH